MALDLPVPGEDAGVWDEKLNAALQQLDTEKATAAALASVSTTVSTKADASALATKLDTTTATARFAVTEFVARMTARPSRARRAQMETLVGSLLTAGVWDKLDALYVMAAHDVQAARLNWVGAAQDLVAINSPAFTVDRGFTPDGTTNYFDTGLVANLADRYKAADGSMGVWVRSAEAGSFQDIAGGANSYLTARNTSGQVQSRLNFSSTVGTPVTAASGFADASGMGLVSASRDATNVTLYKDGVPIGVTARGSEALSSSKFTFSRDSGGTVYSPRKLAAGFIGGGLTDTEMAALHTALRTYLVALGAA